MLTQLHIENIAVIERADVQFTGGFNVLTGETGAGKSIVIDALEAVLGGRTSRESVRTGASKALVTAEFEADAAAGWCAENELEAEEGTLLLLRRIGEDGKSSARINGIPVTAAQLRSLGSLLLDIHGQNDGRQLLDEGRHRAYLDAFGELDGVLGRYREAYDAYCATQAEIERLTLDEWEKERLRERLTETVEALTRAEIQPGEMEQLAQRRDLLRNAERLTAAAQGAYEALYGASDSAITQAGEAAALLSRGARLSEVLAQSEETVQEALTLLEDAAETLRDFCSSLDFSPEEFERLEGRLDTLRRLTKKYGGDEKELLELLETSRQQLEDLAYADDRIAQLEKRLEKERAAVLERAAALTQARREAGEALRSRVEAELRDLQMPSVRFEVELAPRGTEPGFDATGADTVRFLMSANAGETPGRISRIASGGELSRIMLALKSVFAEKDGVPTLVFDEIDTGVSGVAAQRVGEKIAALSRSKQILCVTHLPQIAAMADTHFLIEKHEEDGRTYTTVTRLDEEGRIRELARLHGGDCITEATLLSAREQLLAAARYKEKLEK